MAAKPYYERHGVTVLGGDCLDVLRELADASVDAVVTDPPYGLAGHKPAALITALTAWANGDREHVPNAKGFMGKDWDAFVPPPAVWDECLRVLKPGGYLLAFAGSRTSDLMGLSVRMAGFEIRDTIMWVYGSGFPHGIDVSKAIDKAAGAERKVVGSKVGSPGYSLAPSKGHGLYGGGRGGTGDPEAECAITAPATDEGNRWQGWNTSLKPAQEPIIVARKPLVGTVAANVLAHGTGALNIDATRVSTAGAQDRAAYEAKCASVVGLDSNRTGAAYGEWSGARTDSASATGRWPSNVVLTHHPDCADPGPCTDGCPVAELDQQTADTRAARPSGTHVRKNTTKWGDGVILGTGNAVDSTSPDNEGGASRFFPVFRWEAKAPTSERPQVDGISHPTVKPVPLMRFLVRLVTPPGGLVLDPFAGSGTTLHAARAEGMRAIGVEREPDYLRLIAARLDARPRAAETPVKAVDPSEPMDLLDLLNEEAS